jgi:hypothetical protein
MPGFLESRCGRNGEVLERPYHKNIRLDWITSGSFHSAPDERRYSPGQPKPATFIVAEWLVEIVQFYSVLQNKLQSRFFENLVKSTVLAVIIPYQSPNKSHHDRIRYNQGTKTCENGTFSKSLENCTAVYFATHCIGRDKMDIGQRELLPGLAFAVNLANAFSEIVT